MGQERITLRTKGKTGRRNLGPKPAPTLHLLARDGIVS